MESPGWVHSLGLGHMGLRAGEREQCVWISPKGRVCVYLFFGWTGSKKTWRRKGEKKKPCLTTFLFYRLNPFERQNGKAMIASCIVNVQYFCEMSKNSLR